MCVQKTRSAKLLWALEEGSNSRSLEYVRQSVDWLQRLGFQCPNWAALRAGARPLTPEELGEDEDPVPFKHGWQFHATKHVLKQEHGSLMVQLPANQQALLRSQSGTGAGSWLIAIPTSDWLTLPDSLFFSALRRRLFLAMLMAADSCEACGHALDQWGHHSLACTKPSWLKCRATGLEKAWVQVLSEAGASARHRPLLRDLAVPGVLDTDSRQLDVVAGGLAVHGGRTIVGDATLRSPLSGTSEPHGAAATIDGATFPQARRDKASTYPELAVESARHKFLVLGSEVGGRFSVECIDLVRQMVRVKCGHLEGQERKVVRMLYHRRWWSILSLATQRTVAMNLLGGAWSPSFKVAAADEEELLCAPVVPPESSRLC